MKRIGNMENVRVPPSPLQQQLWFFDRLVPGANTYNMARVFRVTGELDEAALQAAVTGAARRHESLRTVFGYADDAPWQIVLGEVDSGIRREDLGDLPEAEREAAGLDLAAAEIRRPFDLGHGPLFRFLLVRLGPADHLLTLTLHHICTDGSSLLVLFQEISTLYGAYRDGRTARLPEPMQFPEIALRRHEQMRSAEFAGRLTYWTERLSGLEPLAMPTDRPRPSEIGRAHV